MEVFVVKGFSEKMKRGWFEWRNGNLDVGIGSEDGEGKWGIEVRNVVE